MVVPDRGSLLVGRWGRVAIRWRGSPRATHIRYATNLLSPEILQHSKILWAAFTEPRTLRSKPSTYPTAQKVSLAPPRLRYTKNPQTEEEKKAAPKAAELESVRVLGLGFHVLILGVRASDLPMRSKEPFPRLSWSTVNITVGVRSLARDDMGPVVYGDPEIRSGSRSLLTKDAFRLLWSYGQGMVAYYYYLPPILVRIWSLESRLGARSDLGRKYAAPRRWYFDFTRLHTPQTM